MRCFTLCLLFSFASLLSGQALDQFSLIPAGSFQMGDALDELSDAPVVTVDVSAFYMGQYEVTKAEWDEVRTWGLSNGYTDLPAGSGKAANHPVHSINWYAMVKWCNARSEQEGLTPCYSVSGSTYRTGSSDAVVCDWTANGYRLPTEAEWEKAARGGATGQRFPWGDTISHANANYYEESTSYGYDVGDGSGYHPDYGSGDFPYTSPVGSFEANGYGLYDMTGNVYERCWDWYNSSSYSDGAADPRGAASGSYRVRRGGSWGSYDYHCRVALRYSRSPSFSNDILGFRVALSDVPTETDDLTGKHIAIQMPDDTTANLYFLNDKAVFGIHSSFWLDPYVAYGFGPGGIIEIGYENPPTRITINSDSIAQLTLYEDGNASVVNVTYTVANFDPSGVLEMLLNRSIDEDFSSGVIPTASEVNLQNLSSFNFVHDDEYIPGSSDYVVEMAGDALNVKKVSQISQDADEWGTEFQVVGLNELDRDFQISTLIEFTQDEGLYPQQAGIQIKPYGRSNYWINNYSLEVNARTSTVGSNGNYLIGIHHWVRENLRSMHPTGYFAISATTDVPDTVPIRLAIDNDTVNSTLHVRYMGGHEDSSNSSLWRTAFEYNYATGEWTFYNYHSGRIDDSQGVELSFDYGSTGTFSSLAYSELIDDDALYEALEVNLYTWFNKSEDDSLWKDAETRFLDFSTSFGPDIEPPASLAGKAYQFSIGGDVVTSVPLQLEFDSTTYNEGFAGSLIDANRPYTYANGVIDFPEGVELHLSFESSTSGAFEYYEFEGGSYSLELVGTFNEVAPSLVLKNDWQRTETLDDPLSDQYWNVWRRSVDALAYDDGELSFIFAAGGDSDPETEIEYGRTLPMDENWQVVLEDMYAAPGLSGFSVELELEIADPEFACELHFSDYGYGNGREFGVFLEQQLPSGDWEYAQAYITASEDTRISSGGNVRIVHIASSRELIFEYQPDGASSWSELARLNLESGSFQGENGYGTLTGGILSATGPRMTVEIEAEVQPGVTTQIAELEIAGIEISSYTPPATPVDSDGDGLDDSVETNTGVYVSPSDTGTDPNNADSSGDGFSDGFVVSSGFDPTADYSALFSVDAMNARGYYSSAQMVDARAGSVGIVRDGTTANLELQIQRSVDLETWTAHEDDRISVPFEMTGDQQFFRFAMPE